jgi:hypothetical protein
MNLWIIIYLSVGALVGIPLGRSYWKEFRMSNSKHNVVLPLPILNRLVDSFVFMSAWVVYIFLYPLALVELLIKKLKILKEKKHELD